MLVHAHAPGAPPVPTPMCLYMQMLTNIPWWCIYRSTIYLASTLSYANANQLNLTSRTFIKIAATEPAIDSKEIESKFSWQENTKLGM